MKYSSFRKNCLKAKISEILIKCTICFDKTRTARSKIIIRLEFDQFWENTAFLYPSKVTGNENLPHVFMGKEIHH